MTSVLIIGSGISGLTCALALVDAYDVTIITKETLGCGATELSTLGMAAEVDFPQHALMHLQDTMIAASELGDNNAVRALVFEAPAHIRKLQGYGVEFTADGDDFARGLGSGHSQPRIIHAGFDGTGAAAQAALNTQVRALAEAGTLRLLEQHMLLDLIVDAGHVVGATVAPHADGILGETESLHADAVVVATGGAGQLYSVTTNPAGATGDGVAAAYRAGAQLIDTEFYQFHPTYVVGRNGMPGALISETVRAVGATLLNSDGDRFMIDAHHQAEMAPPDAASRRVATEQLLQDGEPILLDVRHVGDAAQLAEWFPQHSAALSALGYDWSQEPVPVVPAAHAWVGGVFTDLHARSSVPGLFVTGEAACTGVHGANRLSGNGLLEAMVYGRRAAYAVRQGIFRDAAIPDDSRANTFIEVPVAQAEANEFDTMLRLAAIAEHGFGPYTREALQALMTRVMGVFRPGESLQTAVHQLDRWKGEMPEPVTLRDYEDRNLIDLARVIVRAALARAESRGAHYRSDFKHISMHFKHRIVCSMQPAGSGDGLLSDHQAR